MGKFRVRVSAKGKRWRKGQSSSSNPDSTKFRDAAKSGFFQMNLGESNLTQEALTKHNTLTGGLKFNDEILDEDAISFGGNTFKTFDTFASDWSHCSNVSFKKLLTAFRPDSAVHKELLAVLAAITEVIKDQGGSETSTEYFAALMTALDSEGNDDDSVYAILTLLSMAIKSVPLSVLQLKFAQSSKTLMELLARFAQSENVAILRPIIGCLSILLRSQESQRWDDPYTVKVLDSLLAFITFSKPKVRKAAQHGIRVIVLGSSITAAGISHLARYCVTLVENVTSTSVTSILHVLALLKDIMHKFPKKEIKSGCEACLKVMSMPNVLISSCCLQTLHGMLKGRPPAKTFPPDRNARLITALYDYQPPPSDAQPTQAWIATLIQAHINLYRNDSDLCLGLVSRLTVSLTSLYLTEKSDVMSCVTHSLSDLMESVFSSPDNTDDKEKKSELGPPLITTNHISLAKALSVHFKDILSYQYHSAWTHILHLMKTLFKCCGSAEYGAVLEPCFKALGDLRDSNQFCYNNEVEAALSMAVRSIGPKVVLKVIPLQINNEKNRDFKRSWILPVLKSSIQGSSLKFYIDYFLPQAVLCRNEAERLKSANDQIGSVSYDLLQSQIWSLLPSFANRPTDIATSFPGIAKALGSVLNTKKDLRMSVLTCLRKLVNYVIENNKVDDLETMSRFAKNYLPILFSIYSTPCKGTDEESTRLATYETIKVYLKISNPSLNSELFERALDKLNDEGKEEFVKESVLDLLRALIQYLSVEEISKIYEMLLQNITQDSCNHKHQKKYFRMIEEICTSESESCSKFLSSNIDSVKDVVVNSLSKAAPSSKGARLRCLVRLFSRESNPSDLIQQILPEAILCVRDINSSTRSTAYNLLQLMADASEPDAFTTSFMAGLSGSQSTVACTLLALAAVVYHYKERISKEMEEQILYLVGLLTICSTREIVKAALSFIKVFIQAHPRDKIATFVPTLMRLFTKMDETMRRMCRTKIRDLLARFVRWYGGDLVISCIPQDDHILRTRVKNLAKIHSRRKRDKEAAKQESQEMETDQFTITSKPKSIDEILAEFDSDSDAAEEEEKPKKTAKGKAWITETPGDIIDFTDLSTAKKISASKPVGKEQVKLSEEKKKKKGGEFKTAPDGRLIISEVSDSDDDGAEGKKKKFPIPGLDDSDDDYEASEDEGKSVASGSAPIGRKRTLSVSTVGTSAQPNKYQAGGSGIHRPIKSLLAKKANMKKGGKKGPTGTSGQEYKAKKAGGDMKRKGMPDPYAYVPLRRDNLNRRKKMKAAGQFKNFIKSAHKGAKMGTKQKMTSKRNAKR